MRPVEGLLAMTVLNRKDEVKAASSFKDKDGNDIEMGLHVFFGCYFNLFRVNALMASDPQLVHDVNVVLGEVGLQLLVELVDAGHPFR